jgi:hypothetical protein
LADITYYEDDYIAAGYHVYTADAVIGLQPYLVEDYIIRDYFESRGVESLLVADLTRSEFIEFAAALASVCTTVILAGRLESATVAMTCTASMSTVAQASLVASSDLTSNFTQTTTANIDRRTSVTLSTIADLASQSVRLRDYQMQANGQFAITTVARKITDSTDTFSSTSTAEISADRTRNITQNITAEATLQATATPIRGFTSNFASIATQLTVAFQNATGTILMEPTVTLSALVGVIREYEPRELSGTLAPATLDQGFTSGLNQGFTGSIWYQRTSIPASGRAPIWSTPTELSGGGLPANVIIRVEYVNSTDLRISRGTGTGSTIAWTWASCLPTDSNYHHVAVVLRSHNTSTETSIWEAWVDGVSQGTRSQSFPNQFMTFQTDSIRLGSTQYLTAETGTGDTTLTGGLAQIWIGDNNDNFSIANYYPAQDLGTGTAYGNLPTPWIYSTLSDPWTDISPQSAADLALRIPDHTARFSMTTNILGVLVNNSNMVATCTLIVQPGYLKSATAALASTASLSCEAIKSVSAQSNLASTAALAAISEAVRSYQAAMNAQADLACVVLKLREFNSNLTSTATMIVAVNKTTNLSAALNTTSTLAVAYTRTRLLSSNLTSNTQTAASIDNRLRDQSAALSSTATLACEARTIEGVSSLMASQFAITVNSDSKLAGH